jgi:hypothetical protein
MGVTLVGYRTDTSSVRNKFSSPQKSPVGVVLVGYSNKGAGTAKRFFRKARVFCDKSVYVNKDGEICDWIPEAEISKSFTENTPVIVCLSGERSCQHKWRHATIKTLERLGAKTTVVFFVDPPLRKVIQEVLCGRIGLQNLLLAIWFKVVPPTAFGVDYLMKSEE